MGDGEHPVRCHECSTTHGGVRTASLRFDPNACRPRRRPIMAASTTAGQQCPDGSDERSDSSGRRHVYQCGR
jgi:hypothetical protein